MTCPTCAAIRGIFVRRRWLFAAFTAFACHSQVLLAQVQSSSPTAPLESEQSTIELSPFVVTTDKDEGYAAQNTLAGSRLNSSLANTPAAIQVLTKELLIDLNATNYESYLQFATNSRRDFSDQTGLASVQQGNNQVNIRGFSGAAQTRDFFGSQTRADRFSIDRYEISRGPNSILFGIGGPGGVVNANSKFALINSNQKDEIRTTVGSWSKRRVETDFNRTLAKGKLAVRLNGLFEDSGGWREFEKEKRLGVAFSATYQPWQNTRIRLNYEYVDTDQNQAMPFPSADTSGQWIAAGKQVAAGPINELSTLAPTGTSSSFNNSIRYAPQVSANAYRYGDTLVADANPNLAGAQRVRFFDTINAPNAPVGGTSSFINFDVLPESANLLGSGSTSDNRYGLLTLLAEQRMGDFALELGYNRQEDSWVAFFPINWSVIGLRGDANPQLPGYYLPTGTLGANPPGQLLASPFGPNPFVGQFYVEGNAAYRVTERTSDNFRATLSYDLDLDKRSRWLGSHRFAALAQRGESEFYTDIFNELNISRDNTQSLNSAPNQIIRRTYVDFTSPTGLRGALDPRENPINSPGVNAQYLRTAQTNRQKGTTDSFMAVVQSNFFDDYVITTLGIRRDEQITNRAGGGVLLPVTNPLGGTWTEDTVYTDAGKSSIAGNTKTLGVVVRPVYWGALLFNASDSIRPASGNDLFGRVLGLQTGVGQDYGARFFLFNNRINLGITRYDTDNENAVFDGITTRTQALPVIMGIYQAFTDANITAAYQAGSFFNNFRDTTDSDGGGWEVELTANPTKRWRISANYSQADVKVSNLQPILNGFVADESPFWLQNANVNVLTRNANLETFINARDGTPTRDYAINPAKVGDARQYVQSVLDIVNLQEGQQPLQHQTYSFNFFNSYSFKKLPLIGDRFTAGFGASYRSAAIVGYANNQPIYGKGYTIWNAMLRKRFLLESDRTLDFQLNVNNVFKEHTLLPYSANATGVQRYFFQRQRQSWNLQVTLMF